MPGATELAKKILYKERVLPRSNQENIGALGNKGCIGF